MTQDNKLLKLINASGFLFQLRISKLIAESVDGRRGRWTIESAEHKWINPETGKEEFIDIVLRSAIARMVIECKRVRDGTWVFLIPDNRDRMQRAKFLWTFSDVERGNRSSWDEFIFTYMSPESSFCVVRGQGEKDQPMLERLAGKVIQSTEFLATQELALGPHPSFGPARVYTPVIVTNATLLTANFDPGEIKLETGTLEEANFKEAPFIRFRKTLSSSLTSYDGASDLTEIAHSDERPVFIVNSDHLTTFLREVGLERFGGSTWPWERDLQ